MVVSTEPVKKKKVADKVAIKPRQMTHEHAKPLVELVDIFTKNKDNLDLRLANVKVEKGTRKIALTFASPPMNQSLRFYQDSKRYSVPLPTVLYGVTFPYGANVAVGGGVGIPGIIHAVGVTSKGEILKNVFPNYDHNYGMSFCMARAKFRWTKTGSLYVSDWTAEGLFNNALNAVNLIWSTDFRYDHEMSNEQKAANIAVNAAAAKLFGTEPKTAPSYFGNSRLIPVLRTAAEKGLDWDQMPVVDETKSADPFRRDYLGVGSDINTILKLSPTKLKNAIKKLEF